MNKEQNKIGFALQKVTTQQFAIIESSYKNEEKFEKIALGNKIRFGINFKQKTITVLFLAKFTQKELPFLIIEVGCHFSINETAWNSFLDEPKTKLIFPRGFISHLVMLTIGTTRGVLHSKTENTLFNRFLLPTLNVNDLVKEDVVFDIKIPTKSE